MLGLAKYNYQSNDKAIEIFKKIASNKPEFFEGYSQLAELLTKESARDRQWKSGLPDALNRKLT